MQHNTAANKNDTTKLSDKKSLKINLASLQSDKMTGDIFGMTASVEKNYYISTDEIDILCDGNAIHWTEVKYSTSDDSE